MPSPPCNETEQKVWVPKINPFGNYAYKEICPDGGKCTIDYTNSFGTYKDRICGKQPAQGIMHASVITSGSFARDVLYGGLGFHPAYKITEVLSSYWTLVARMNPEASCTESMDVDREATGEAHLSPSYFMLKFHGGAEGWGQTLYARFLKWLQTLDADSNGEVSFEEIMLNRSHLKRSTRELCTSSFVDSYHGKVIKRYIQLADEWYDWCSSIRHTIADEEEYLPMMCQVAYANATAAEGQSLAALYYNHWLKRSE